MIAPALLAAALMLLTGSPPDHPLESAFAAAAAGARGRVGAACIVLETGETAGYHADDAFPMQSVYKLPIAMAALKRVDSGALALDDRVHVSAAEMVPEPLHSPLRDANPNGAVLSVRELVRLALVESDGTASDVLLLLAGGPAAVSTYLRSLGVEHMAVSTTEAEMARAGRAQYRNSATPRSAIWLLRQLYVGHSLSASSNALVLRCMAHTTIGERRIKGLLPPGTRVAHKTGTSGTVLGMTAATNDIGVVTLPDGRRLAIAVFVRDSRADEATRERVIARIARAAWDRLTRQPRAIERRRDSRASDRWLAEASAASHFQWQGEAPAEPKAKAQREYGSLQGEIGLCACVACTLHAATRGRSCVLARRTCL